MNLRKEAPVIPFDLIGARVLDRFTQAVGITEQAIDVDALAHRSKRLQPSHRSLDHLQRADGIAAFHLQTRYADLQHAPIEITIRSEFPRARPTLVFRAAQSIAPH